MKRYSVMLPIAAGLLAAPQADAHWLKVFDAEKWTVGAGEAELQDEGWIFQDWDFIGYPQCVDGTRDCTGVREVVAAPYGGSGNTVSIRGSDPDEIDPANSRSIAAYPLPETIPLGGTATLYFKFAAEGTQMSTHFGLTSETEPTSESGATGARHDYGSLSTHSQVSFATRSTLGVFEGFWVDATLDTSKILEPGIWYELWYHITNAPISEGGGYFDLYIRGGAFGNDDPFHLANPYVGGGFTEWYFRLLTDQPLARFLNIHNSGNPATSPPRSDAIYFDDMYLLQGEFSLDVPGDDSGPTYESLWKAFEDFDGWKTAGIGWVYDAFYPWIYHGTAEWLYVLPENASLESMYLYDDSTGNWLWTSDDFSGWYYDYSTSAWSTF